MNTREQLAAEAMTAPEPQVAAPLPRVLDADETAAVAALWNHASRFANDRLRANGLELRGNEYPGVANIVLHQDGGDHAILLTLATLGPWRARPQLDINQLEQAIPLAAGQIADIAGWILEDDPLDRAALARELEAVERALLDQCVAIEDSNPLGLRPAWRPITAEDLVGMSASVRLVKYEPAR